MFKWIEYPINIYIFIDAKILKNTENLWLK